MCAFAEGNFHVLFASPTLMILLHESLHGIFDGIDDEYFLAFGINVLDGCMILLRHLLELWLYSYAFAALSC